MLTDPVHEFRLAGLLALVEAYKRAKGNQERCREIVEFYLANTTNCNNWDLVDLSSQYIIGDYMLLTGNDDIVRQLIKSENIWEQRIAVVSTIAFIRNGELDDTYRLASALMGHKHDLMHKACGWMLREAGKRDPARLVAYVEKNSAAMPRTMLRYAIERLAPDERRRLMALKPKKDRQNH